jgi:hypothetical protein
MAAACKEDVMPQKTPLSSPLVAVTFRMPPLDGVVELYLCGDFNAWHLSGAPLAQRPDGSWETTLELEAGRSYRYRYYDNQGRWHNDWEADAYEPNEYGSEDSVVNLEAVEFAPARPVRSATAGAARKVTPRKAAAPKPTPRNVPKDSKTNRAGAARKRAKP